MWTEASPLAQAGECRDGPSLQLLQFLDKLLAGQRPLKTPATIQAASDCIGSDLQPPPPISDAGGNAIPGNNSGLCMIDAGLVPGSPIAI